VAIVRFVRKETLKHIHIEALAEATLTRYEMYVTGLSQEMLNHACFVNIEVAVRNHVFKG
jgi:hypothetical protein